MATLTTNYPTLIDLAKKFDHKGNLIPLVDALYSKNHESIIRTMPFYECNNGNYHELRRVTSRPSGTWTSLDTGASYEKSKFKPVLEGTALLETNSRVGRKELMGLTDQEKAEARNEDDMLVAAGLGKTHATAIFYGDQTINPKQFDGLAKRMNSLSTTGPYVLDNGGTVSNMTSVYAVRWGKRLAYGIYPQNTQAGLQVEDMGKIKFDDEDGNPVWFYVTNFLWRTGLAVHDLRSIGRLCNINPTYGGTGDLDTDNLIKLINKFPSKDGLVLYVNETIQTQLDILAADKSNVDYQPAEAFGVDVITFRGVPIIRCDVITDEESQVS